MRTTAAVTIKLLLMCAYIAPMIGIAVEGPGREDQLVAAYLYNFLKFIEWPTSGNGSLTVCVMGADGVHDALATGIDAKAVGARPLAVRRLQARERLEGCDALYVDAQVVSSNPQLASVRQQALLTVSNAAGYARDSGIIEIFTSNNRLRFNVNLTRAERAGLRISSNLLKLAVTVERDAGE